ncbi:hypothetical protein [Actinoplanes sp. NPDC049599]|uniref:hypothetical protein n=1 Tax=Actinoplanes sp. NPDC049599 TaxID=3363903 RepID=UPI00379C8C17
MRNEVPDDENVYDSVVARRNRRRKQVFAGVAGVAVLGAGAFLVTSQLADETRTETRDAAALAPAVGDSGDPSASATASASASASPSPSATVSPSVKPSPPTLSKAERERVRVVRSAAAKASSKVHRPLVPRNGGATVAAADLNVSVIGSVQKNGEELRLYSARQDLTGQKELAWVTDDHERVGTASCTQKIRLSQDVKARERPTLLICWRTSTEKSVYTVAVKMDGRPSASKSVATINKEWARLG